MVKMENISFYELLTAYIQTHYPAQRANHAVLVIDIRNVEFDCEMDALKEELDKYGVLPPPQFLLPGFLIVEMNQGMAQSLVNIFDKSGFTMLLYRNGEIIHENR